MSLLTENQRTVLLFLANTLKENNIEFHVTGGLAAIAYGAKRPLYDIDVEIYERDVEKVRVLFQEYVVEDWNNELEGPEDNFDVWMMKLNIKGVPVDISQIEGQRVRTAGGEWISQPEIMSTEVHTIEGIELPIQNKHDLIAYKTIVAREIDLEDIRRMSDNK